MLKLFNTSLKNSSFLNSSLLTTAILKTSKTSFYSIFENANLKKVPINIGKTKVQNINDLLLNKVFKE